MCFMSRWDNWEDSISPFCLWPCLLLQVQGHKQGVPWIASGSLYSMAFVLENILWQLNKQKLFCSLEVQWLMWLLTILSFYQHISCVCRSFHLPGASEQLLPCLLLWSLVTVSHFFPLRGHSTCYAKHSRSKQFSCHVGLRQVRCNYVQLVTSFLHSSSKLDNGTMRRCQNGSYVFMLLYCVNSRVIYRLYLKEYWRLLISVQNILCVFGI